MKRMQQARSIAFAVVLASTIWAVFQAEAQQPKRNAASTTSSAAAIVNGEKITRAQVFDEVMNEQTARLNATNDMFADHQRVAAASVGALVLKHMAASNGQPVTVTRADIMSWIFKDNPPVLSATVERMIQAHVVQQAARKQGITVSEDEVKQRVSKSIDTARKQFHLEGQSDEQILKAFGMRPALLREGVLTTLYVEKLIQKEIETKMGHKLGPDDYLDASHILVRVPQNPSDPAKTEQAFAEAKTKIMGYAEEIKSGKVKFEDEAKQHSDDGSKFNGGKLAVFVRGQNVPEFEKVAFTLKPGVLSEPVRSQFGWHLIMVNRLGKDLKPDERQTALDTLLRSKQQIKVTELMAHAMIVNNVTPPERPGPGGQRPIPGGPRTLPGQRPPLPGQRPRPGVPPGAPGG